MLVIRDLMLGKERYQEFLTSPEKISTNILADRLKRLQDAGIVIRWAYQNNPVRYKYALTDRGDDLRTILKSLASWGLKNFPGTKIFFSVRDKKQQIHE